MKQLLDYCKLFDIWIDIKYNYFNNSWTIRFYKPTTAKGYAINLSEDEITELNAINGFERLFENTVYQLNHYL